MQLDTSDAPSDYYTFAGEIPWHPHFAAEEFAESNAERAYREIVRVGVDRVEIEILAHGYAWESYHSEMNRAGHVRVPSRCFSNQFDLRSAPQSFDQFLADGTRATVTLRGIDEDVLYVREDLLRQYVDERIVVWFVFGERGLHPYPLSPPQWLRDVQAAQADEWCAVLTEADLGVMLQSDSKT